MEKNFLSKAEMEQINEAQVQFYSSSKKKRNIISRIWAYGRGTLGSYLNACEIKQNSYELHRTWLGDLSHCKVLDLGCYSGNALSEYLAKNSAAYLGIDLSEPAIHKLQEKISKYPKAKAKATATDFLKMEGKAEFDIIYAYAVLHHFKYPDVLIEKIKSHLKPGGRVITYDPLQTFLPMKILRVLYRPFQSDAKWEWPFSKSTLKKFGSNFEIVNIQGLLGKSKWAFIFWPFSKELSKKFGKKWASDGKENTKKISPQLYKCLHVMMNLKKI